LSPTNIAADVLLGMYAADAESELRAGSVPYYITRTIGTKLGTGIGRERVVRVREYGGRLEILVAPEFAPS
jgi:hypothetical protein